QREQDDCRDQHLAVADPIRQAPRENREDAPHHAEYSGEPADIPFGEPEVLRNEREERRDDPAVEADEAETETEQRDRFPLVRRIPSLAALSHLPPLCCCRAAAERPALQSGSANTNRLLPELG